jgi:hypothetical protein
MCMLLNNTNVTCTAGGAWRGGLELSAQEQRLCTQALPAAP